MRYRNRINITVVALMGSLLGVFARAEVIGNEEAMADFPLGAISFGDANVSYTPADTGTLVSIVMNPDKSLGLPDYTTADAIACATAPFPDCNWTTLGRGGEIVIQFTDNVLTGSGDASDDLFVFEVGPLVQGTIVEISEDGDTWFEVGTVVDDVRGVDIDDDGFGPGDFFWFVRLTDNNIIDHEDEESESEEFYGADIDAVGTISAYPGAMDLRSVMDGGNSLLASYRPGSILVELRNAATGAFVDTMTFFPNGGFTPITFEALSDTDNDGVEEIVLLASRNSDGRAVVEIRNVSGDPNPRRLLFKQNHTPIDMAVIEGNADGDINNIPEIAVLSSRDVDGRGRVEIRNADGMGATLTRWIKSNLAPLQLAVLDDADGNAVPDVAVLASRVVDGRIAVEIQNAAGLALTNRVWFKNGHTAVDFDVINSDAFADGAPEIAVLAERDIDGRIFAFVANASGPPALTKMNLPSSRINPKAIAFVSDSDNNTVDEIAVLASRASDGRNIVTVMNADGGGSQTVLIQRSNRVATNVFGISDSDGDFVPETAVLTTRVGDGRMIFEIHDADGSDTARTILLKP